MKIPKPSDGDKVYFQSIVPEAQGVETKPMFGNLAAFVNGNMFMGLFGPEIGLRLAAADRDELASKPGAGAFGPKERPMKDYVTMPRAWRDDLSTTSIWVDKALAHTSTMPAKAKKKKAKK
ncbi:MAG: TfoX/Sxy family protein [Gaiellaceae bacterium]